MKFKSIIKRIIVCLCIFLLLFNFMVASVNNVSIAAPVEEPTDEDIAAETQEEADNLLGGFLNGFVGMLTLIPRLILVGCSMIFQSLGYFVVNTAGHGDNEVSEFLSPFDIFFNKFTLTNINIFQTEDIESSSGGNLVYSIRETAAMLYYIVRAIAIGILLIMLLLIGIKMAVASLAEEKAKVKNMFFDWLVSVGLVIMIHMIILVIININEFLVGLIENVAGSNGINVSRMVDSLRTAALSENFLLGWGSTFAYAILTIQTMIFAGIYIIRLFKVVFLIIISPIMPLTYSLDRAKGGQSISFNGWIREFAYNVFIQVIHCIIYVVIIAVPMAAIETVTVGSIASLTQPLILVIALMFVGKAEKLIMSLFGFDKSISLTSINSVNNNVQRAVATGISVANGTYTVTNNVANNTTTFGSNIQTLGDKASNKLHEYRDKAATWLDNHEKDNSFNTRNLFDSSDSSSSQVPTDTGDSDETGALDADYVSIDENGNPIEDQNVLNLSAQSDDSQDLTDKVAAAVASTKHDEENSSKKIEEIKVEEDEAQEEIPNPILPIGLMHRNKERFDELKRQYEKIMDEIKDANNLQKEILDRLEELEKNLDDDSVNTIRNQLEKLMADEGEESARAFADSLGDSAEGKYAQEYFKYLSNQKELHNLTDGEENVLIGLLNNAQNANLITEDMKNQLIDNARNVEAGGEDKTNNILRVQEIEEDTSDKENKVNVQEPEVQDEVIEGDVVSITKDIKLPRETFNVIKEPTIRNARLLEAIDGEINIEGDFSDSSLTTFDTRILEKAKTGAYSQSNFEKAEEAVRREGDIAVRRLEKFRAEQSEENARMLTPAGRQYAELMVEAQQAGVLISSARFAQSGNVTGNVSQDMSTRRQTRNTTGNPVISITNPSSGVINDLSKRKRA